MVFHISFYVFFLFSLFARNICFPQGYVCKAADAASGKPFAPVIPKLCDDCGLSSCPSPPKNGPPMSTLTVCRPTIRLPANVPPTKTVGNTCNCVKTVVKPQVIQQLISVPSVRRYIETSFAPVVEHMYYHGIPLNCPPYALKAAPAQAISTPTALSKGETLPSSVILSPALAAASGKSQPSGPPPASPAPSPCASPASLAPSPCAPPALPPFAPLTLRPYASPALPAFQPSALPPFLPPASPSCIPFTAIPLRA